eukprot:250689-Amphidinium_carterae.2
MAISWSTGPWEGCLKGVMCVSRTNGRCRVTPYRLTTVGVILTMEHHASMSSYLCTCCLGGAAHGKAMGPWSLGQGS